MGISRIQSHTCSNAQEAVSSLMGHLYGGGRARVNVISIQAYQVDGGWKAVAVMEEISEDAELQKHELEEEAETRHREHNRELERKDREHGKAHHREMELEREMAKAAHDEAYAHEPSYPPPDMIHHTMEPALLPQPIIYHHPIDIPVVRDYISTDMAVPELNDGRLNWLDVVFQNDFESAEFGTASHAFMTPNLALAPVFHHADPLAPAPEPA